MKLRITTPGDTFEYDVPADKTQFSIGSAEGDDVRVKDDPKVSGPHVKLENTLDKWTFSDEFSKAGTLLNGEKSGFGELKAGDVLTLGDTKVEVLETAAAAKDAAPDDKSEADPAAEQAAPATADASAEPGAAPADKDEPEQEPETPVDPVDAQAVEWASITARQRPLFLMLAEYLRGQYGLEVRENMGAAVKLGMSVRDVSDELAKPGATQAEVSLYVPLKEGLSPTSIKLTISRDKVINDSTERPQGAEAAGEPAAPKKGCMLLVALVPVIALILWRLL